MTYAMTLDNSWELMSEDEMYEVNGGLNIRAWMISAPIDAALLTFAPQSFGFLAPLKLANKWLGKTAAMYAARFIAGVSKTAIALIGLGVGIAANITAGLVLQFATYALSIGGIISGILDLVSDGTLNGIISI